MTFELIPALIAGFVAIVVMSAMMTLGKPGFFGANWVHDPGRPPRWPPGLGLGSRAGLRRPDLRPNPKGKLELGA